MPALACTSAVPAFPWEAAPPLLVPEIYSSGGTLETINDWTTKHSSALYRIDGWGVPYFSINPDGELVVRPHGTSTLPHQDIPLVKVIDKAISSLGLPLPLLIRFPDVLKNRLECLHGAFDFAVHANGYGAHYQGVYPVKCNQDRFVVEDIVKFGEPYRFGLEAGSKPELLLAMSCIASSVSSRDAFLICNGYKDEQYVALALLASRMEINTVIVLEQEEELDTVVEVAHQIGVRPVIGLRAKLRTKHSGHFGSTSGEKGKFGLTTSQILSVVAKLRALDMLDCLQLLHFHIGSQIPSTALLADGVSEATQIYCELSRLGAGMRVIDVGGGLGIDYDGSHSAGSDMSVGYNLDEYAAAVVQAVKYGCDRKGIAHPILCSESGRALVSHHSVLVFEAFSVSAPSSFPLDAKLAYYLEELVDDARVDYNCLMSAVVRGDYERCGFYADQLKNHCVENFKDGTLGLEHLAAVDGLCELVSKEIGAAQPSQNYHINLSIFSSIPDFWAIGQLFPIVPLQRMDQRPSVEGTLVDLTCDSDGKINKFIDGRSTLPLHDLNKVRTKGGAAGSYYMGMFLGGAYQEALGGLHNLFGGPSVVRVVQSDGPHCFAVTRAVPGPSCADVLRSMQHQPDIMFDVLCHRAEEYSPSGENNIVRAISQAFSSMPYLAFSGAAAAVSVAEEFCGIGSDTEGLSSGISTVDDQVDEEWEFMRGLTV